MRSAGQASIFSVWGHVRLAENLSFALPLFVALREKFPVQGRTASYFSIDRFIVGSASQTQLIKQADTAADTSSSNSSTSSNKHRFCSCSLENGKDDFWQPVDIKLGCCPQ